MSLRQWERSADLLFREQARDMASMAAEKVAMVLRHGEDEFFFRLEARLAGANAARGVEELVAESPLVARLYVLDRAGRLVYPAAFRDGDAAVFGRVPAEIPPAVWERGGRRDLVVGEHVIVAAVLKARDGAPVVAAVARDLEALKRDVLDKTLASLEAPTIVAVLDHLDRRVWSRAPVERAEPVTAVTFRDELPRWRLALYQPAGFGPRQAVRRQVMVFTAAFVVLLALIAAGIVLAWRLTRRETEMARLKSDFVANVSHDLKTPLSVIRMFGETLEMGRVTSEAQRQEYYRVITRESERLSRLIDNVLDFSRIEGGRRRYDMAPAAIEPLVRETLDAFAIPLEQHGFKVDVDVPPDLPQIRMDADAVGQALANLVDNAIKYSGERRALRVAAVRRDGGVALSVEDDGLGIPRDEQARIFEKFYRVGRSETQGRRGSGVGLALVHHVVEAHGGRVTVDSEPGRGSRFTLWLPVR
ncbi:MAG: two-component sensor histidine kinase [Candidatus Rokubacteria bacterium]|nr:two-component sensor histidine kinase [Candidatus Rokubacteria bacterium]